MYYWSDTSSFCSFFNDFVLGSSVSSQSSLTAEFAHDTELCSLRLELKLILKEL